MSSPMSSFHVDHPMNSKSLCLLPKSPESLGAFGITNLYSLGHSKICMRISSSSRNAWVLFGFTRVIKLNEPFISSFRRRRLLPELTGV